MLYPHVSAGLPTHSKGCSRNARQPRRNSASTYRVMHAMSGRQADTRAVSFRAARQCCPQDGRHGNRHHGTASTRQRHEGPLHAVLHRQRHKSERIVTMPSKASAKLVHAVSSTIAAWKLATGFTRKRYHADNAKEQHVAAIIEPLRKEGIAITTTAPHSS
jgi:hypothetical protein